MTKDLKTGAARKWITAGILLTSGVMLSACYGGGTGGYYTGGFQPTTFTPQLNIPQTDLSNINPWSPGYGGSCCGPGKSVAI